jgi:hypothetical protein
MDNINTSRLVTQLYNTNTRFLYELIQHAEDNRYHDAEARFEDPSLSFALYHDRIVIDSNEDGFTENDIKAICSTGESTKINAQGYIGEKGYWLQIRLQRCP